MYIPLVYEKSEWSPQEDLIKKYPLGTIISNTKNGLIANHVPFHLHVDADTGEKYLHAHLSKRNPQIPSLQSSDEEVLVIFQTQGSYISPSYYPTKAENEKVVPTWDFGCVHCYGTPKIIDDAQWVRKQLDSFTKHQEKDREHEWQVSDAPEKYVTLKQKAIIGLEIHIKRTECKFKFEQDMPAKNIDGVIEGLAKDSKQEVSDLVKESNGKI